MVPINPRDFIMATIANLTVKADGSFQGLLATINVTAPIAIVPNGRKPKDTEPAYSIVRSNTGLQLGAGLKRITQHNDTTDVSVGTAESSGEQEGVGKDRY